MMTFACRLNAFFCWMFLESCLTESPNLGHSRFMVHGLTKATMRIRYTSACTRFNRDLHAYSVSDCR